MSNETTRAVQWVTILGIVFTIMMQGAVGIWWASRITAVQDTHTLWIGEQKTISQTYPVLEQRVTTLEANFAALCSKLDKVIDTLNDHNGYNRPNYYGANNDDEGGEYTSPVSP